MNFAFLQAWIKQSKRAEINKFIHFLIFLVLYSSFLPSIASFLSFLSFFSFFPFFFLSFLSSFLPSFLLSFVLSFFLSFFLHEINIKCIEYVVWGKGNIPNDSEYFDVTFDIYSSRFRGSSYCAVIGQHYSDVISSAHGWGYDGFRGRKCHSLVTPENGFSLSVLNCDVSYWITSCVAYLNRNTSQ